MSDKLNAARAAMLDTIQLYAPLGAPIREDAIQRLYAAMDDLQAAAIADVQVPAAAPPLPPGGQPVAAATTPTPPDAPAPAPAVANPDPKATKTRKAPGVKAPEAASAAPPAEVTKETAPPEAAAAPPAEAPKQ